MKISDLILDSLKKNEKSWQPHAHYPSSASFKHPDGKLVGPDLLMSYLKWKGVKPSNPSGPESLLKMKLGNGVHETLAKILAESGVKVLSEVGAKATVPGLTHQVSYRVDHLIEAQNGLEVLEVKSSSAQQMFGRGWGIKDKGVKEDHLLQVACYLALVPGVTGARILYIARDTGEMLEYVVEKDQTVNKYWPGIVARWRELEDLLIKGVEPAPEYPAWLNDEGKVQDIKTIKGEKFKTPWRVSYCDHRDYIWSNPANRKYSFNETGPSHFFDS